MFNSAIFSIHGVDGYTRVHLAGLSGEKVQNHKDLMGQVGTSLLKTQLIVFLIALIAEFTLAELEMQSMGGRPGWLLSTRRDSSQTHLHTCSLIGGASRSSWSPAIASVTGDLAALVLSSTVHRPQIVPLSVSLSHTSFLLWWASSVKFNWMYYVYCELKEMLQICLRSSLSWLGWSKTLQLSQTKVDNKTFIHCHPCRPFLTLLILHSGSWRQSQSQLHYAKSTVYPLTVHSFTHVDCITVCWGQEGGGAVKTLHYTLYIIQRSPSMKCIDRYTCLWSVYVCKLK